MSVTPAARQSSTSLVTSLLTILWTGQSPAQHSTVHYSTLQYSTLQYSTSMVTSDQPSHHPADRAVMSRHHHQALK